MLAVLISCLLVIAVTADLMTDRIPNALTVTGLTAGLLIAAERAGPPRLLVVLRDMLVMFFVTFLLFRLRAMRGGDGKLLCALAALLGIRTGLNILFYSMLFAVLIGIGKRIRCRYKKEKQEKLTRIHYSVPILAAVLVCCLQQAGFF